MRRVRPATLRLLITKDTLDILTSHTTEDGVVATRYSVVGDGPVAERARG
jgi:hypothetical protein